MVQRSIRTKILIYFMVITFISLASIAFVAVLQGKKALFDNAVNKFKIIAEEVYYHTNRVLLRGITDAKLISNNPIVSSEKYSLEDKKRELQKLKTLLKIYEDISLIDLEGNVFLSTDYKFKGSWKNKTHFSEALSGKFSISEVYFSPPPSKLVISFTAPVYDNSQKLVSIVSAQLGIKNLSEILEQVKINNTGCAFLLDENNRIITGEDPTKILTEFNSECSEQIRENKKFLRYTNAKGDEMLGNYFPRFRGQATASLVAWGPNWKVVVVQDAWEVYKFLSSIKLQILLFSTLLFCAVIIIGLRFSDTLTEPIKTLTHGTAKVIAGDLKHQVEITSNDEIAELTGSFNQMLRELQKLISEREKAERAICESRDLYQVLVETVPYGIMEYDMKGTITFGSSNFYRMLGYPHGELFGRKIWDTLASENEKTELQEYHRKVLKDHPIPTPYFAKHKKKDGTEVYIQVNWNYRNDDQGDTIGYMAVLTDISTQY